MTDRRPSYAERRLRADARRAERAEIDDPAVVLEAAAAFLAVRPRSVDETRRRLRHLGYPAATVEVVLDRLLAYGYLDDEAFARVWVESRDRARPRGETVLRRELTLKGIDRETIATVLAERQGGRSDVDPVSVAGRGERSILTADGLGSADELGARRLVARRAATLAREPDPRRRRQKAYALLARNGFSPDVCARVSSDLVAMPGLDGPAETAEDGV